MSSRAPRERRHDYPLCRECFHLLDDESMRDAERSCSRCRERQECIDLAWNLSQFHGVRVHWTKVRDHGSRVALGMAMGRYVGGDMEVLW
jgi:hypothetical protein